jgi:CHAD domain-containing protein
MDTLRSDPESDPPTETGANTPSIPARPSVPLTEKPGVEPDDLMSEAGRKILAHHFARMLAQEDGVRRGEHEAVHDMRVATRRLRSALDIFSPYYEYRVVKPFNSTLRKVGRALGAVRDLDVFRLKADKYTESLPTDEREGLSVLLASWQAQIDEARANLSETLNGHRYAEFVDEFAKFVLTPGKGAIKVNDDDVIANHVRHVAPALIYERYGTVRAYEVDLEDLSLDKLHALRIDAKRLRYALEAFEEALKPDAKKLIEATKQLQDHLGDLQDARVAGMLMQEFVHQADEQQSTASVLQYMAVREEEKQRLLASVWEEWQAFAHADLRRALAMSISAL